MFNILKSIEKEVEKGNLLIDSTRDFLNHAKTIKKIKKDYALGIKDGTIDPVKVTYTAYESDVLNTEYVTVYKLLECIQKALKEFETVEESKE